MPPQYWKHRLITLKALGLNTVSTYLVWGLHQPSPERFVRTGQNDVAAFCRLAQAEGLRVILRPGPYICGEADFGGMPGWLLGDPNMQIRSGASGFMQAVQRYFKALGEQVAPLQSSRGGPIILVQVENEYDGYGSNDGYTQALCAALRSAGIEVPLFTSEMGWSMKPSAVPGLIRGVGMASDVDLHIKEIRRVYPEGPLFCSELYTGWFDAWGRRSSLGRSFEQVTNTLERLLARGAWFNLYMAHGGTSFGFMAGANDYPFRPNTTSYDYGRPSTRRGGPHRSFLRSAMC